MNKREEKATTERYRMLDLLRGATVFVMIAAHAIYFFHNDSNSILLALENAGNTIAFTIFLIVSAATAQIAYFSREDDWPERRKKLIKRVSVLALGYLALAAMIFFADISSTYGLDRLTLILNVITLRNLAPFAEFLVPFIVFPLIISLFPKFFRKISDSAYLALIFGLAVYLLGMFYYQLPIQEFFTPWKALFFGASGYYRFPIFQYFPIYLLGMVWGNYLTKAKDVRKQKEIARAVMIVAGVTFAIAAVVVLVQNGAISEIIRRWPPSIPFLSIGVFAAAMMAYISYTTCQLRKHPWVCDGLLILGQNALGLTLTHVFLLQIYSLSGGLRTGSVLLYLFSFVVLLILSVALSAIIPFNFRFALNKDRGKCTEHVLEEEAIIRFEEETSADIETEISKVEKFIKKRHILGAIVAIALVSIVVLPPIAQEYQSFKLSSTEVTWDNNDYGWRRGLTIANDESLAEIPAGNLVKYQVDHAALVSDKKSYSDGRDLTIRYWDGKNFSDVKYWLSSGVNTSSATITFELTERLKPGDTTKGYYLFYGGGLTTSEAQTGTANDPSNLKYSILTKDEESFPVLLTADRRWLLVSDDPTISKSMRVALTTSDDYSADYAKFSVDGTDIEGTLVKTTAKQWEGVIDASKLDPGEYDLTATIETDGTTYTSSKFGFYVSYPLYIAWTQDWEGYDVPDAYLSAITQIAEEHGVAITHFWNPRLTTTDTVAQNRKDTLLSWVKNRQESFGDSIGMHLHMFTDFVTLAGVEAKNLPNWGDSGDGYGSLTTNYTAEELTKIIKKGVEVMQSNGLNTPTIYRAGGWFANLATLQAIQDSGFLADASGRTAYKFYNETGPWNLSATAQPYYPSTTNQNETGTSAFNILEIPNNGADSYWFSTDEMKSRFTTNYSGGILTENKQITYLSHPHWFNKTEQSKIESVFDLIDNYKYDNDSGPAIYVTLDTIYEEWSK